MLQGAAVVNGGENSSREAPMSSLALGFQRHGKLELRSPKVGRRAEVRRLVYNFKLRTWERGVSMLTYGPLTCPRPGIGAGT